MVAKTLSLPRKGGHNNEPDLPLLAICGGLHHLLAQTELDLCGLDGAALLDGDTPPAHADLHGRLDTGRHLTQYHAHT